MAGGEAGAGRGRVARRPRVGLCLCAGLVLLCCSGDALGPDSLFPPETGEAVPRETFGEDAAFVGVTLVPMTFDGSVPSRTVIVRNGRIDQIGSADSLDVPAGMTRISGEGRYLMPGLADMHTHVATSVLESGSFGGGAEMWEAAKGELLAYVAFGVTTILNNGDFGAPLNDYRQDALLGTIIGPTMYTAMYARGSVSTPDGGPPNRQVVGALDARTFVIQAKVQGYDFMKVYNYTPLEAFDAIVDEASGQGMAVIGHFPQTMSREHALRSGMVMVAHAEAYAWTGVDTQEEVSDAIALTLENGAWVTGTHAIREKIARIWGGNSSAFDAILEHPATRYAHPTSIRVWKNGFYGARWRPSGSRPGDLDDASEFVRSYSRAMYEAGVPMLLGTDSPTVLGVAGYSAHEELEALTHLGLSPFQILEMGTVNANDFISRYVAGAPEFGTVEVGKEADLILLNRDPLADVGNLAYRAGVMTRGHWYSSALLRDRLEALARAYGN